MNRSSAADLIKASSIFGVVYIHGSNILGTSSLFQDYVANFFRFCVPCFIIIWAYFFEKSYEKKTSDERKKYIKGKLKHLFIVFITWSIMYFFVVADFESLTVKDLFTKHFSGYGWSGQYFFIVLFQLLILYPFLRSIFFNKVALLITSIVLLGIYVFFGYFHDLVPGLVSKIGIRVFIYWVPYVFIGILLAKQKIKSVPAIFASSLLLIPLATYFMGFERSAYLNISVLFASALFCISLLEKNINLNGKIGDLVSFVGKNTMIIFATNPMVILFLRAIMPKDFFSDSLLWKITAPFLSTILIISICLLLNWIIDKVKLNGILK